MWQIKDPRQISLLILSEFKELNPFMTEAVIV